MDGEQSISGIRGFDSFEVRLGDSLRGERATLGKSLLDVQRDLRIKAAYIAAIEHCDPAVFPNKGFIAGYVRSYARYLNLDPEEVFARFCQESKFDGVNAGLMPRKRQSSDRKALSGPIRKDRDDPLFRPMIANAQFNRGALSDISLSAVGSFLVLIGLVSGLAYASFMLLADIQRVDIEPVGQRPSHLSDMVDIVAPGLGTETVTLDTGEQQALPTDQDLARLYQPRELEIPVLSSRDGPIVDIDPDLGRARQQTADLDPQTPDPGLLAAVEALGDQTPVVREETFAPGVRVVAQRPAWVRVYMADGTVLFEKILDTGEAYTLPADVEAPLLRAGNAGSVFVAVNQTLFGPIGSGTGVAKNISLMPDDVSGAYAAVADIPDALRDSVGSLAAELDQ